MVYVIFDKNNENKKMKEDLIKKLIEFNIQFKEGEDINILIEKKRDNHFFIKIRIVIKIFTKILIIIV